MLLVRNYGVQHRAIIFRPCTKFLSHLTHAAQYYDKAVLILGTFIDENYVSR